ncbi:MAG: hypothetical protein U0Q21_15825 [Dermatophilaceae bacterium]
MGIYDVEVRTLTGDLVLARYRLPAVSEAQAVADTCRQLPQAEVREDCLATCYRLRRRPGRRRVLAVSAFIPGGGGGEGDGLAGVREPRRPLPGPGHLYAAADLPLTPEPR